MPITRDEQRPMPNALRAIDGSTEGYKNAFKHGRYTAEALAERRYISELLAGQQS